MKLFLDVDGVINHYPRSQHTEFPMQSEIAMGYEIMYHKEIWDKFAALPLDIHWLTTWNDHANDWIGPMLGWDKLPVFGTEHYEHQAWGNKPSNWWKYIAMQELALKEPFIWIDDELLGYGVEEMWEDVHDPHLFITPKGSFSNDNLAEIEAFLVEYE